MREAGFRLQCVHFSGNAPYPERNFRSGSPGGGFRLVFAGCRLLLGLFFHSLLVGFLLQGAIVNSGEGWELFADHVVDFGADLVRAAGGGRLFLGGRCWLSGLVVRLFDFFGEQAAVAADQPVSGILLDPVL